MAGARKASGPGTTPNVVSGCKEAKAGAQALNQFDCADGAGATERASELPSPLHIVEESAEVRAERVRALREQIANGTYNPDPYEVARKLVERGFR